MQVDIRFPQRGRSVRVPAGTLLMDAVREAGLPLARACGGGGLCGRCGVRVDADDAPLPAESADETRAKQRNRIDPSLRLVCRMRVEADVSVSTPYW